MLTSKRNLLELACTSEGEHWEEFIIGYTSNWCSLDYVSAPCTASNVRTKSYDKNKALQGIMEWEWTEEFSEKKKSPCKVYKPPKTSVLARSSKKQVLRQG